MKIEEMIAKKNSDCCGCEACKNICPKNAISMARDAEGFAYPKIDKELCIQCGKCDATCPSLNFREEFPEELSKVFIAINPDEKIRRHSSSGGVFSALAEIILNDGGIVFGAGFDENWHVVHTSAENFDEMKNLRGSKYVQSQIGETFRRVKKELSTGRKVFFTGTSCQCTGLKSFLGKDFENLLTVDVFCHGVPSPEIWEKYIEYLGQGHEISDVDFRNKRNGWFPLSWIQVTFKDCGRYIKRANLDPYFQEFLMNTFLRPSCYDCKFRFPNIKSDISIGDAWGIKNFAPDMHDFLGVSLAVIHTNKGKNFLEKANLKTRQTEFHVLPAYNPYVVIPSAKDSRREKFFADLAQTKNPVITMKNFFLADTKEVSRANNRQNNSKMSVAYKKILTHYSKKRVRNMMIFTTNWNDDLKNLTKNFLSNFGKDVGLFVADIEKNEKDEFFLKCFDADNTLKVHKISVDDAKLSEFKNDFGLTDIVVIQPFNFKIRAMLNWVENCKLPIYAIGGK